MTTDQHRLVSLVVRWGLPLIVLLFYLTASRRMEFTSDGTYATLDIVRTVSQSDIYTGPADLQASVSASPLWVLLIWSGGRLGLDTLIVTKVFSLFFSCMMLVLTYLAAFEITGDRLLAFCSAFIVATQSWLLFLAPGGTAVPMELALVMAAFFFLLRNEYSIAAICAGLASLVGWEGILLIVCIVADAGMNIVMRGQVLRITNRVLLIFAAMLSPWIAYAWRHGIPMLTAVLPSGDGVAGGPLTTIGVVLPAVVVVAGVGVAIVRREGWIHLRVHAALIAWTAVACAAGLVAGWEHGVAAMPILLIGAVAGAQRGLRALQKETLVYTVAFSLAAVLLLVNQVSFTREAKPIMVHVEESTARIEALATWVRTHVPSNASVASSRPGQVGFLAERPVMRYVPGGMPFGKVIVCEEHDLAGFTEVPLPPEVPPDIFVGGGWKIWKQR